MSYVAFFGIYHALFLAIPTLGKQAIIHLVYFSRVQPALLTFADACVFVSMLSPLSLVSSFWTCPPHLFATDIHLRIFLCIHGGVDGSSRQ